MLSTRRVVGLSWLMALAALALWALPARAGGKPRPAAEVRESAGGFESGGKRIQVRRFEPTAPGQRPALVLLHGADGPKQNKDLYHAAARRLAARGYHVLFVHYFDRTATGEKDNEALAALFKKCLNGTATREQAAASRARFREWTAAVRDAVAHARTLPGVDRDRVGLVGFSLGAYLALAVAAQEDLGVAAVVEFFGGLPREVKGALKSLPPVLGFHGDKDRTVPVKEAEDLRDLLAARGLVGEVHIYKGVGHVFQGEGQFCWQAALDAETRTAAFLDKHLKRPTVPGPGK